MPVNFTQKRPANNKASCENFKEIHFSLLKLYMGPQSYTIGKAKSPFLSDRVTYTDIGKQFQETRCMPTANLWPAIGVCLG